MKICRLARACRLADEIGQRLRAQRGVVGEIGRRQRRQDRQRHLGADALDIGHQQLEPFALEFGLEAIEPDHVFADIGLDEQHSRFSGTGQGGEGARRTKRDIADAMDVEHAEILADLVDGALQLADHVSSLVMDGYRADDFEVGKISRKASA
jgi:hypothetical protein